MKKKAKNRTGLRRALGTLLLLLLVIAFLAVAFAGIDGRAAEIKGTVAQAADSLRNGDLAGAASALDELDAIVERYYSMLTKSPLAAAKWLPGVGKDVNTAIQYMELWREAYPKLLVPAFEKAQAIGLPNLETLSSDPSALSRQIREYADLYEALFPELLAAADTACSLQEFRAAAFAGRIGPYQGMLKELARFLPALEDLPDRLIRPAADLLESYPPFALRTQEGFHVKTAAQYLAFFRQEYPYALELTDALARVDLRGSSPEMHEKLMGLAETARSLLERAETYVTLAQSVLGNGEENRYFLIFGQNSAELRAGGGFPGVVCIATVKDGYASLGDFSSSWKLVPGSFVQLVVSQNERELFGSWFSQIQLIDATFNPHFPMVANGWALGHGYRFGTSVDGILSATPHLVQELLEICGPITLSNGAELTYDNCMQYLQHDIYYQYLARDTADLNTIVDGLASDEYVDALFEETAKTLMEKMFDKLKGHFTIHDAARLMDIVDKSFAKRTLMAWSADEAVEQQLVDLGMSGSLNCDPQKPEIGVYFSVQDANKVGFFVDIDTACDDARAVKNDDGSVTWPVTVRLHNTLTQADLDAGKGNWYKLLGSYGGDISSIVHFFAPAGGRIEDITYAIQNRGGGQDQTAFTGLSEGEYEGLQVFYNTEFWLYPGETIEFAYKVTTAPGVSTRPAFSVTPVCSLKY